MSEAPAAPSNVLPFPSPSYEHTVEAPRYIQINALVARGLRGSLEPEDVFQLCELLETERGCLDRMTFAAQDLIEQVLGLTHEEIAAEDDVDPLVELHALIIDMGERVK